MTSSRTEGGSFWNDRIVWGLKFGFRGAGFLSACAILLFLMQGSQPFRDIEMPLSTFLGVYAVNGIIGGLIAGLTRPLMRTTANSAGVGLLIGLVLGATFGLVDSHPGWTAFGTVYTLSFGLTGLLSGALTFRRMRGLDVP